MRTKEVWECANNGHWNPLNMSNKGVWMPSHSKHWRGFCFGTSTRSKEDRGGRNAGEQGNSAFVGTVTLKWMIYLCS